MEGIDSANVVLFDMVDHLAAAQEEALFKLRDQTKDVGANLVVRVHGAWRDGTYDYLDAEGPDIDCVWDAADHVLVATRGHLVRLASFGGIDADRTRLAPVAFDGPTVDPDAPAPKMSRTHLLVAGETHRAALGPVLEMLAEVDPDKATFEVLYGLDSFRESLPGAGALVVPALGSFGDRSIIDAALRAGVRVIASPFAGATDRPLPGGVEVVSKVMSSAGWRAALERGLALEPPTGFSPAGEACARQEEILRTICAEASNWAGRSAA